MDRGVPMLPTNVSPPRPLSDVLIADLQMPLSVEAMMMTVQWLQRTMDRVPKEMDAWETRGESITQTRNFAEEMKVELPNQHPVPDKPAVTIP